VNLDDGFFYLFSVVGLNFEDYCKVVFGYFDFYRIYEIGYF